MRRPSIFLCGGPGRAPLKAAEGTGGPNESRLEISREVPKLSPLTSEQIEKD